MCSGFPNNLGTDVVAKCGDIYRDYELSPVEYDGALENELINFDITNFNNVGNAAITIFQVVTLEGWSSLMYNYQDTVSYTTSSLFFVMIVLIGAFTTLNLCLASIMHSYMTQTAKRKAKEEEDKLTLEIESKRLIILAELKNSVSNPSEVSVIVKSSNLMIEPDL